MALQVQRPQKTFNCSTLPIKHCPSPFSPAQVIEYLETINLKPTPVWKGEDKWDHIEPNLKTLETVMRKHVVTFPYESTEDHYTTRGYVSWKEQDVFRRLITEKKGYGTICFGHSFLLRGILRVLGYRAITTGTRNNSARETSLDAPTLLPLGHTALLVTVPGQEVPFLVDVGFGARHRLSLLPKPIPLISGAVANSFIPPEEYRVLVGDRLDLSLDPIEGAPRGWWLQARHSPDTPWRMISYFTVEEYTANDFEYLLYGMSTLPHGPGRKVLFCVKLVEGPSGTLVRYAIEGNVATKKVGSGEKVVIETFRWEHERIDAIRRLCGIQLNATEALKCVASSQIVLPIQNTSRL